MKKMIIYKITDAEETVEPVIQYFTINGLKKYVLNELWDYWDNIDKNCNEYTKKEIEGDNEYLFAFLYSWGYKVDRILWGYKVNRIPISDNKPIHVTIN